MADPILKEVIERAMPVVRVQFREAIEIMLGIHPELSPDELKALMMTRAKPVMHAFNEIMDPGIEARLIVPKVFSESLSLVIAEFFEERETNGVGRG